MINALLQSVFLGLVRILGLLPVSLRVIFGRALGTIFYLIPTKERQIAQLQMELCLQREGGSRNLLPMYQGIGQSIAECLNIGAMLKVFERYVKVRDQALINSLRSDNRGVLALSAHLSNWDLLAGAVTKLGFNLSTAGKEARSPTFQKLLVDIRSNSKVDTIWRSDPGASMKIFKKLKKGEMVATLLDQDTDVPSIFSPFFSQSAHTPYGMVEIGKRAGARIAIFLLVRTGFIRYEMRVTELPADSSVEEILRLYNQVLENTIREFPWQWMWVHKRWRTTSTGERLRTAEYINLMREKIKDAAR